VGLGAEGAANWGSRGLIVHRTTTIDAWRSGWLLGLGLILVLLLTAFAPPAKSSSEPAHDRDLTRGAASRSSQWTAQPPLQLSRNGLGVVRVGDKILAIGGHRPGEHEFDAVEARNVEGTGKWRYLEPMPTARGNLATAVVGGLVYAVGGYENVEPTDTDSGQSDAVETFNPRSGHWARSLRLPKPRAGPAAAGLGGLLYVAGGEIPLPHGNFHITDSVIVYDPGKNTWRSVAPMHTARERLDLVAAGGYLYAIGGDNQIGASLTAVERYDTKTNTWRTMNPLAESRTLTCAVETKVGKRRVLAVVAGGENSADGTLVGPRSTTEVLDLATGRWTLLNTTLLPARAAHDCATKPDGTILTVGGVKRGKGDNFSAIPNVDALSLKPSDLR
jgi:N-acetylneuraminic acid mutarotase